MSRFAHGPVGPTEWGAVEASLRAITAGDRARLAPPAVLPRGAIDLIRVAADDKEHAAALAARYGVDPKMIEDAALHFIHAVMFHPDSDHFRVLGVHPDDDEETLKLHFRWLQKWLHPDRDPEGWVSVYAERVNTAWSQLRRADRRAEYRERLASLGAATVATAPDSVAVVTLQTDYSGGRPAPLRSWSRWARRLPAMLAAGVAALAVALLAAHRAGEHLLAIDRAGRERAELATGSTAASPRVTLLEDQVGDHRPPAASDVQVVRDEPTVAAAAIDGAAPAMASDESAGRSRPSTGGNDRALGIARPARAEGAPSGSTPVRTADDESSRALPTASAMHAVTQAPVRAPAALEAVPGPPGAARPAASEPPRATGRSPPMAADVADVPAARAKPSDAMPALMPAAGRVVAQAIEHRAPAIARDDGAQDSAPSSGTAQPSQGSADGPQPAWGQGALSSAPAVEHPVAENPVVQDPPIALADARPPAWTVDPMIGRRLLNEFSAAYREGRLQQLVVLFAPNAKTPEGNLLDLHRRYDSLFESSTRRSLEFLDVEWRPLPNGLEGVGRYEWAMRPRASGKTEATAGRMRVVIEFFDGRPLIVSLHQHDVG